MNQVSSINQQFMPDHLSFWDVAHYWSEKDPKLTHETDVPTEIQHILIKLTRDADNGDLAVADSDGNVLRANFWLPSFNDYIPSSHVDTQNKDEMRDDYWEYCNTILEPHRKKCESFHECYRHRKFNKQILTDIHLDKTYFGEYCIKTDVELPNFWFSSIDKEEFEQSNKIEKSNEADLRPSQVDKELCRAIASTLWGEYPDMTIKDMTIHKAIQQYGNGTLYKGRDTIRNWIKDLAPNKKSGRPKKDVT